MTRRVHVLQHVAFEGLGSLADLLDARGAQATWTRFHAGDALPAVDTIDAVIALGGPMSVNDEASLPWLVDEKRFIHAAMQRGLPVLGICLGAQLIASACGARVYPATQREIGWFAVDVLPAARARWAWPDRFDAFHWHGETFDLPAGAERLAATAACPNQAFRIGTKVVGLQFHLEMTAAAIAAMVEHGAAEIVPGPGVQSAAELLAPAHQRLAANRRLLAAALDDLLAAPGHS
jgi:GMP synthase-like glutamine amidotransferase